MKSVPFVLIALLFSAAASAQLPFQQQQPVQGQGDAVAVDPTTHHVLFENEFVRVFRALASAGRTSPNHTHPPTVLVSLSQARFNQTLPDGTSSLFDFHPAQVVWLDGFEHSWELAAGDAHIIGIEVKPATAGIPRNLPALPDSDAVARDPGHHHVLLENDHVRVYEALAETGATSPMHTHAPLVLVSLGTARLALTMQDGTSMFHDFTPGQVLWIEGEHSWEVLAGSPHVFGVEVKAARRAPARP